MTDLYSICCLCWKPIEEADRYIDSHGRWNEHTKCHEYDVMADPPLGTWRNDD